ncbi:hypothetical protein [uncultured Helcococcus sp.]|uniref:hypothetical protein n=1 Tax=uncultured Helcococcus sp. TaxID=1072508 RepID=UPI00288BEED7|nr:hypothetical protein [uncultured Helcococcus sp.]
MDREGVKYFNLWKVFMRYISTTDRKEYSYLLELLDTMSGYITNYKWLITDVEAYSLNNELFDLINEKDYIILSTDNLIDYLKKENFQWIWAVFSAIPETISDEEILTYKLPKARDNYHIYEDDFAIIQHPLAEIEIVAEDSLSIFIVTNKKEIFERFKRLYPNSKRNY